eukprot:s3107_g3.t1
MDDAACALPSQHRTEDERRTTVVQAFTAFQTPEAPDIAFEQTMLDMPPFVQPLYHAWDRLAVFGPGHVERSAFVAVWYLDHLRFPQCFTCRAVRLYADVEEWETHILNRWNDHRIPNLDHLLHVVPLEPRDLEDRIAAHVIISQQVVPDFKSLLMSTSDSDVFQGQVQRFATIGTAVQDRRSMFALAFRAQDCHPAQRDNLCRAWIGHHELLRDVRVGVDHGDPLAMQIVRPVSPDVWEDEGLGLLQLRHSTLVGDPSLAKPLVSSSPVTLVLDAVIPHARDYYQASEALLDSPSAPQLLWFDVPNLKAQLMNSQTLELAPLPDGMKVPRSTLRQMLNPTRIDATRPGTWEVYVDGSTVGSSVAWAVVFVYTDGLVHEFVGTLYGSVQTCPNRPDWIGAVTSDNISAELTAMIVAQVAVLGLRTHQPCCIRPDLSLSRLLATSVFHFSPTLRRIAPPVVSASSDRACVRLQLRVVTANVLALDSRQEMREVGRLGAARTLRLDRQWHAQHIQVVGIQEARTEDGVYFSEHYKIFASGAHVAQGPHHGCELWLHRFETLFTGPEGVSFTLADVHTTIAFADPRRLFVHCQHATVSFAFVVLHAPCLGTRRGDDKPPIQVVQDWWTATAQLLQQHLSSPFVWVMVGANAPLASHDCEHFGTFDADPTNAQGEIFEQFILDSQLFAPSTFSHLHTGVSFTWTHSQGARSRKDYVLVSELVHAMTLQSSVLTHHDTSFAHEDHVPVLLETSGWIPLSDSVSAQRPVWSEEAMLDPIKTRAFFDAVDTLPVPAWDVHVDDHCRIYEQQLCQLGQQIFTPPARRKHSIVLPEGLINLISFKRQVLDYARAHCAFTDPVILSELKFLEHMIKPAVRHVLSRHYDTILHDLEAAGEIHNSKLVFRTLNRLGRRKTGPPKGPRPLPLLRRADGPAADTYVEQQQILLTQFAKLEAGQVVSWSALESLNRKGLGVPPRLLEHDSFPDPWQLQMSIRKLVRGKAPGPNHLPTALLKAGSFALAKSLSLLMMKATAHAKEPLAWKGGRLIPLWKGKDSPSQPEAYRSIFVSSYTAKLYHQAVRSHLVQVWEQSIRALQFGGRKGCGTDVSHHLIQAHQSWTASRTFSSAIVFFDLRAAFYMVLRQCLTSLPDDDNALAHALTRWGLAESDVIHMLNAASPDCATDGLSGHMERIVHDLLSNTFFLMDGISFPCRTARGTRPGDPIGDILFNMVMSLVLNDFHERMAQTTEVPWMGADCFCNDLTADSHVPDSAFCDVTFVDDCAIMIHAPTNTVVQTVIQQVLTTMFDVAKSRGLEVNFSPGKTEVIWNVRGPGSRALKAHLHSQGSQVAWSVDGLEFAVRLVPQYRHLGTWLQAGHKHMREILARGASAKQQWGQLARSFFSKKLVSLPTKAKVFQALVLSRLTYNAHVWFYPGNLALPTDADVMQWVSFVCLDPNWKGRVKAALHSSLQYHKAQAEAKMFRLRFDDLYTSAGGILPVEPIAVPVRPWQCDLCSDCFASKRALAMHACKVHGYKQKVRFWAAGSTCNKCCQCFHSRKRLAVHLAGNARCFDAYQACFPPLAAETVDELDAQDRVDAAQLRKHGWWATKAFAPVMRVFGPPLPDAASPAAVDMCQRWRHRIPEPGDAFLQLQGRQILPAPLVTASVWWHRDDIPSFVLQSNGGPQTGHGAFQMYGLAQEAARLHFKHRIFVHFFSGFRRQQDLHEILEELRLTDGTTLYVLSIDMCMQKKVANLSTAHSLRFWKDRLAAGEVCGIGGGPPCESYSAARHAPGGPPPLRSATEAHGLPALRAPQWLQVLVGSRLVQFHFELLLMAALCGACAFFEHPQYPTWLGHTEPASVWTHRAASLLRALACTSIVSFDQCTVGAVARKPTCLMLIRLPWVRTALLQCGQMGRCNHGPAAHEGLVGRQHDGQFKTARAKVYPVGLSRILAEGIATFANQFTVTAASQADMPSIFHPFVHNIFEQTAVQPDFYPEAC